jgi:preprotein translocase subunit SecE
MTNLFNYFEQAYDELIHKVTWPTWQELQQSTVITLVSVLFLTLIVFVMDGSAELVFENFYKIFK